MFDTALYLHSGAVTEDGVGSGGMFQILDDSIISDLGAGLVEGKLVVDVSAIEIFSNDEAYKISLQGSEKSDFADTIEDLAILELGAAEVIGGDQDSTTGRYIIPFRTEKNGTIYRYVRLYIDVSGTISTGITFLAYLGK